MKRYTAQEMRIWAGQIEFDGPVKCGLDACRIADMLRQAADDMEREEKREKKYEYADKFGEGVIGKYHTDTIRPDGGLFPGDASVVRREVGEWEEVPND